MHKYITQIVNYWQYKIIAGLIATVFSDSFFQLLVLLAGLEIIDIFTRWICQSKACWQALYPQSKASIFRYIRFIWTARRLRFIQSDRLRAGIDKLIVYTILILTSSMADTAMAVGGAKIYTMTSICIGFLCTSEGLSIIENLSEISGYDVLQKIKEKLLCKIQGN